MVRKRYLLQFVSLMAVAVLSVNSWSGQKVTVNQESGAVNWKIKAHGVDIILTQLLPDQLYAFYLNRGFSRDQIEPYVTSCVFSLILQNNSAPGKIHFLTKNWTAVSDESVIAPMDSDDWLLRLERAGASRAALVAFRWAQFPSEHAYEPVGDWNQGMLAIDLPKGSNFKLIMRWDILGNNYEGALDNVQCAG